MSQQVLLLQPEAQLIKLRGDFKKISNVEERRLIGGYASVEVVDMDRELIKVEALRAALQKFMADKDYRNVHVVHSNVQVGKVLDEEIIDSKGESWQTHVDEVGLFVVCEIDRKIRVTDRVWEAIERGELHSFSIAGEAIKRIEGEDHDTIVKLELHEITLCVEGKNTPAKFRIIKAQSFMPDEHISPDMLPDNSVLFKQGGRSFLILNYSEARKGETGDLAASVSSGTMGGPGSEKMSNEHKEKKDDDSTKKEDMDAVTRLAVAVEKLVEVSKGKAPNDDETKKPDTLSVMKKLTAALEKILKPKQGDGNGEGDGEPTPPPKQGPLEVELKALLEKLSALLEQLSAKGLPSSEGEDGSGEQKDDDQDGGEGAKKGSGPLSPEQIVETVTKSVMEGLFAAYPAIKKTKVPSLGGPGANSPPELTDEELSKMSYPEMEQFLRKSAEQMEAAK